MTAAFGVSGDRDLRADAIEIWRAGVAAVDSAELVRQAVQRDGETIAIWGHAFRLDQLGRICVVGGGKAGAGMAAGLEAALGADVVDTRVCGWLNVPADCVVPLRAIHLHGGRPAGINEPTAEGVAGAEHILRMVGELTSQDLCVVLLSGGASALLPAPVAGVSLADKQAITRRLSRAGATIRELNCVRKQLSRIKGGRLAAACRAGTLIALIISDIVGDPLDVIGSGPTVADASTPADALAVLRRFDPGLTQTPRSVINHLERAAAGGAPPPRPSAQVWNHVIGNNQAALDAAAARAAQLGYEVIEKRTNVEGVAADLGRKLAERCRVLAAQPAAQPRCLLSGGEPVVRIESSVRPQKGGRNQELVLAAVDAAWETGLERVCILSGGTDGEDGPTDAAGGVADDALIEAARRVGIHPAEYLATHNSYAFLENAGGLLKTGPTHTNVMDVRVALIS